MTRRVDEALCPPMEFPTRQNLPSANAATPRDLYVNVNGECHAGVNLWGSRLTFCGTAAHADRCLSASISSRATRAPNGGIAGVDREAPVSVGTSFRVASPTRCAAQRARSPSTSNIRPMAARHCRSGCSRRAGFDARSLGGIAIGRQAYNCVRWPRALLTLPGLGARSAIHRRDEPPGTEKGCKRVGRCVARPSPVIRAWPYVLIAVVVFGAYAWTGQYWLDVVDEGYFLDLAARVERGQVPYRDFDTYYSPGIFYLFAGIFQVFGESVWPIRLALAAMRALSIMLLVRLTLRGAPWPFPLLPVLTVLALDRWPIEPEPHPAWPALLASLLTMEALAAHQCTAQRRWLVVAGAAAAVAFLFKQNTGAFAALGIAGYVVFRHRRTLGWSVLGFAALLGVAVTALLLPGLAPFSVLALWLPVLLALAAAALLSQQCAGRKAVLWEVVLTATPFALLTIAWLIPLAIVLRPYPLPVGLFAGAVNQAGLASPWPDLSPGARVLLQVTALVVAAASRRWRTLALAFGVALLVQLAPTAEPTNAVLTDDPHLAPLLTWLNDGFGTLHLYLPAAAWAAVTAVALGGRPVKDGGPPPWAVLFATLSSLALYPRLDAPHVITASPTVLIVATGRSGGLGLRAAAAFGRCSRASWWRRCRSRRWRRKRCGGTPR
jgi:hypothetical protein